MADIAPIFCQSSFSNRIEITFASAFNGRSNTRSVAVASILSYSSSSAFSTSILSFSRSGVSINDSGLASQECLLMLLQQDRYVEHQAERTFSSVRASFPLSIVSIFPRFDDPIIAETVQLIVFAEQVCFP